MIKFYFSIFIFLSFQFFGQSFPDLNASTGNDLEYPVDKDTNIYMFQGGRLSKVDKNFNTIWSYTYTGISFTNLLLSKTGSMYFIATSGSATKDRFGKINANGNLAWIKPIQGFKATVSGTVYTVSNPDCMSLLLDRSDNLIVTGNMLGIGSGTNMSTSYFLKCDTNGIPLKFKAFRSDFGQYLVVLNDSAGIYKFMGSGQAPNTTMLGIHSYSDPGDSLINFKVMSVSCGSTSATAWKYYRSKTSSKDYYIFSQVTNPMSDYSGVVKATDNAQVKWSTPVHSNGMGYYITFGRMEQDDKGNIFASISCGGSCPSYTSAFIRIDSNGIRNTYLTKMLSGYNAGPGFPLSIPNHSPRVIHSNNYYFDIWGYNFPNNPVTVQRFNSSLLLPCGSTVSATNNCFGTSYGMFLLPSYTVTPVSSYTIGVSASNATPTTYSVNANFCTVLATKDILSENKISVYPNPANDKIHIEAELPVETLVVFDINGKRMIISENTNTLDVSRLAEGMYFLKVKTAEGEFNRKFIKN